MKIDLPDINELLKKILLISDRFEFNKKEKTIKEWRKHYIENEISAMISGLIKSLNNR